MTIWRDDALGVAPDRASVCGGQPPRGGGAPGRPRRLGELTLLPGSRGLVLLAHGADGAQQPDGVRHVAQVLQGYRLSTLVLDLGGGAAGAEAASQRLQAVLLGLRTDAATGRLPHFLFGVGACAAAALLVAADRPRWVAAVATHGGPLAQVEGRLPQVRAATLLLAGGRDGAWAAGNQRASRAMQCEVRVEVVPGTERLLREPGALDTLSHLVGCWFVNRLPLFVP